VSLGRQLDAGLGPGTIRTERDGSTVEVEVDDVDRLGARVRTVRVTGAHRLPVEEHAARLPDALRVLPGRIVPVEVSPSLGGAVLRTAPEDLRDREFYEVRTDGGSVEVERRQLTDTGREPAPFTLTREQLRRLVDDLGGSFGGA